MKRVIKFNDGLRNLTENEEYAIISDDNIQKDIHYCECFSDHGHGVGCYDAGCYSPDNDQSIFVEGEEENHTLVNAINYHDGRNWRTILLRHEYLDSNSCDAILLDEDDDVSIKIISQFENSERPEFHAGTREFETENFIFLQSQFTDDYSIATVEVIVPFKEYLETN